MRYVAPLLAMIFTVIAVPALAQDRTPPAGSLRALQAPQDVRRDQLGDAPYRFLYEGRSAYERGAPDGRDGSTLDRR